MVDKQTSDELIEHAGILWLALGASSTKDLILQSQSRCPAE